MKFRKDINGLRAIAVIAVVLFHFNASWMPGGFAGVDVFFVISGFLMTGIIFRGIEQEKFSILNFYVARANRIIPALALLCLVLLVFGWFYLTPLEYRTLGKHAASSVGFLSNFIYWTEAGYFDAASHEKWLLHTWSLSVEWQFYIIYPLILVAMRKFLSIKTMKFMLIVGTVLGFIFCVIASYRWPSLSYYLLPTRAWEMMIGGVAYLYPFTLQENRKRLVEWAGLALVIGSYFLISAEKAWPGYLALFPVVGSFLIIQAQRNDSVITSNIVFQKIGAWSYSIYLWHWPLVVIIYTFSLSEYYIYLGMALSILLGFLSYKYVEKIRFRNDYNNIFTYLKCKPMYIAIVCMIIGTTLYVTNGVNINIRQGASSDQAKFLDYYATQHKNLAEEYWVKCNTHNSLEIKGTYETDSTCIEKKGEGGVFLWGDSHAEALSLGLRTLLASQNIPFYQKTSSGCEPSLRDTDMLPVFKEACDYSNKLALESIEKINPSIVVITQDDSHEKQDWSEITKRISLISNAKTIVVGPVPQWKPSLPQVMVKPKNWNTHEKMISDIGLDLSVMNTDKVMNAQSNNSSYEYISLINKLCKKDEINNYYCRVRTNDNNLLQVDYGHLSQSGSLFVVNEILADSILELYNK